MDFLINCAIARRGLELAKANADAPEAAEALAWVLLSCGSYDLKTDSECDAAYDLIVTSYLDSDAILPVCRRSWTNAAMTTHAEAFLRAALIRSKNANVRAMACLGLARHQRELAWTIQELRHPVRAKRLQGLLPPGYTGRIEGLVPEQLMGEAASLCERTIKEFGDARPMGKQLPTLGQEAEGFLFELRNLQVGCTLPEIDGADLDGKPMKLSEFRGKVMVLNFWAGWCSPCMRMVPAEKALVDRMKGRPFVLVGYNGNRELAKAKTDVEKNGINWRSFWDGGPRGETAAKWGVHEWPTVFVVDAKGVIRDVTHGPDYEQGVDALVAEAEAARKS